MSSSKNTGGSTLPKEAVIARQLLVKAQDGCNELASALALISGQVLAIKQRLSVLDAAYGEEVVNSILALTGDQLIVLNLCRGSKGSATTEMAAKNGRLQAPPWTSESLKSEPLKRTLTIQALRKKLVTFIPDEVPTEFTATDLVDALKAKGVKFNPTHLYHILSKGNFTGLERIGEKPRKGRPMAIYKRLPSFKMREFARRG